MSDLAAPTSIPTISADEALAARGVVAIDLRSEGEYAEDHLPGALNIPLFGDAERAASKAACGETRW